MRIPEVRTVSEKYEKLGMEIIGRHPLMGNLYHFVSSKIIKLIFLESTKEKKSVDGTVYGDCEKIADSKRWAIDADFVITLYKPNIVGFTEDQLKVLLLHELMHVGVDVNDKGDIKKYIVPHSVQDFRYILDKYGFDWPRPFQQLEFDFEDN